MAIFLDTINVYLDDHVRQQNSPYFVEEIRKNVKKIVNFLFH